MKLCVQEIIHNCLSAGCVCPQGLNRVGKDSQVGRDGARRKDWHDYEAIKKDASRSGGSRTAHAQGLRITGATGVIPFLLCVSQPCEAVL